MTTKRSISKMKEEGAAPANEQGPAANSSCPLHPAAAETNFPVDPAGPADPADPARQQQAPGPASTSSGRSTRGSRRAKAKAGRGPSPSGRDCLCDVWYRPDCVAGPGSRKAEPGRNRSHVCHCGKPQYKKVAAADGAHKKPADEDCACDNCVFGMCVVCEYTLIFGEPPRAHIAAEEAAIVDPNEPQLGRQVRKTIKSLRTPSTATFDILADNMRAVIGHAYNYDRSLHRKEGGDAVHCHHPAPPAGHEASTVKASNDEAGGSKTSNDEVSHGHHHHHHHQHGASDDKASDDKAEVAGNSKNTGCCQSGAGCRINALPPIRTLIRICKRKGRSTSGPYKCALLLLSIRKRKLPWCGCEPDAECGHLDELTDLLHDMDGIARMLLGVTAGLFP